MNSSGGISKYAMGGIVAAVIGMIGVITLLIGGFGKNDVQNWQIVQSVTGNVSIRDDAGFYFRKFATVWTYPRAVQREFKQAGRGNTSTSADRNEDQSIPITFNDGGKAKIDCMIRYQTPSKAAQRRVIHEEFGTIAGVTQSVRSHLINCAKATAPLMSSTEHMSSRKAEYTQLLNEQLSVGLYEMRRVRKTYRDETDIDGKDITVFVTEIVRDENGNPKIAQVSPLAQYGLVVTQFSIEDTEYDPQTLKQFAAKKESLLEAEKSKAEREQEVQLRLMVVERGLRQKAEVEADANKKRAEAVINAERVKRVAELGAEMKASVALQTKIEAETKAEQKVSVATLELEEQKLRTQSAAEQAQQVIVLAEAEKERIEKAGAVTEMAEVLARIAAERDVAVARELAKVAVPQVVIAGGGNGSGGSDVLSSLIQLMLLKQAGIIPTELNPVLASQSRD